MTFTWKWNFK